MAVDLGTDSVGKRIEIVAGAVKKIKAECDGANIQMFASQHINSGGYFAFCKHF